MHRVHRRRGDTTVESSPSRLTESQVGFNGKKKQKETKQLPFPPESLIATVANDLLLSGRSPKSTEDS